MIRRGVYLHWPYCARICPYCDFNVRKTRVVDEDRWVAAFDRQLERHSDLAGPGAASSVYFGGGTPSLMAPASIGAILERIDARIGVSSDAEITIEANPTDAETAKLDGFRAAGVNRLSLGVQSLDDADLRFLGRNHDAAEARRAVKAARKAFERLSLDLIYALPDRDEAHWRGVLQEALEVGPDHLSPYQLTLEPGTAFARRAARGEPMAPPDDRAADLYEITQNLCEAAGLPAYEVSNHARPGAESRHNRLYWTEGAWFGLGPGAHGRIDGPDGARFGTLGVRDPGEWLASIDEGGDGLAARDRLTARERADEALAMGLRSRDGVSLARLASAGVRVDDAARECARKAGLLAPGEDRLIATPRGRLVLDRLMIDLLAD